MPSGQSPSVGLSVALTRLGLPLSLATVPERSRTRRAGVLMGSRKLTVPPRVVPAATAGGSVASNPEALWTGLVSLVYCLGRGRGMIQKPPSTVSRGRVYARLLRCLGQP
jgi:hypothetical protein